MQRPEKKSVEKNYIYNLMYQMIVVVIPLITTPYVSRVLKADGVGAFSFTTAVTGYFVLFGNLGVSTYGQLKIAGQRDRKDKISRIFFELIILRFILMSAAAGAFLCFIHLGDVRYKGLYMVLLVQILAAMFDIAWLLQGLEEFKKIVIRNIIIKATSVLLIFLFVKRPSDLYLYALIMNGSTFLGNLSIWLYIPAFMERVPLRSLRPFQHLRYCLIYFIPTIATTIYLTLDKTMLGWMTDTSLENGYYEQAHKIEQMAVTVVTSLSLVTMPRMAYLFNSNRTDMMRDRLEKTIRFILLVSIPMCLGMMAVSEYFIPLFLGEGFEKSILLLKIFSLLLVVVGLNNAVGKQVLMPAGRQGKYNTAVIAGACVNALFNALLIPRYYSAGAAAASVLAETVILLIFLFYAEDFIRLSWIAVKSVKYLAAGAVMYLAIRLSYRFLTMSWKSLILQILAGIAIYGICVLLLRDSFVISFLRGLRRKKNKSM